MLSVADLETNVLEFRQRSFQYERTAEVGSTEFVVFGRTETETERKLRPRLLRLAVVVPLAWVAVDETSESLTISRGGPTLLRAPATPVVEVAAEAPEFREHGIEWRRVAAGDAAYLFVPAEHAEAVLAPDARAALGLV